MPSKYNEYIFVILEGVFMENGHSLILDNRSKLEISGVSEIIDFDEKSVNLITEKGKLQIKGDNIKIGNFNTSDGNITIGGSFWAIIYVNDKAEKDGFVKRLLK